LDEENISAKATNFYDYSDETSGFLATYARGCGLGDIDPACSPYEPTTTRIDRCGHITYAMHVRGGPFREWGAGVGRRLQGFAPAGASALAVATGNPIPCPVPPVDPPDPNTPSFCPRADERIDNAPGKTLLGGEIQPLNRGNYYEMIVDLSEWEGISFWARRGPDSQAGFRVVIGDRQTDDDVAFLKGALGLPTSCRRYKECGCRNHKPCTPHPDNGNLLCWDPAVDLPPRLLPPGVEYEACGVSRCDEPYEAYPSIPDLDFNTPYKNGLDVGTNTCSYYAFDNDQAGEYCYDTVNGPPPAEGTERCGDGWMDPVTLGPDWAFYKVPFTELRQEGWAKRFPRLDQAGVTMVRFTWSVGWVDYWIDDVRFYRKAR
jgi:hypothetical protein